MNERIGRESEKEKECKQGTVTLGTMGKCSAVTIHGGRGFQYNLRSK